MPEPLSSAAPPSERKPRPGDLLELVFERFDERGRACGRWRECDVRVRHGVVGSRARVKVLRRRGARIDGHVIAVLAPGPAQALARCAHFPACGGCSLQDLDYEAQLAGLQALVTGALAQLPGFDARRIEPIVPARERWHYRNKMEFSFGSRRWIDPSEPAGAEAGFALGLHAAELYLKVIDVRSCSIQPVAADRILASARELARAQGLAPWDVRTHTGLLRHLVFRCTRTGEILVNLVTSSEAAEAVGPYAHALLERHPEITTLVQNVNSRVGQSAQGEREIVLHGPGHVLEQLAGVRFAISANSFFQTNSAQGELLFEMIRAEAGLTGSERLFDLYCGTGAIGLVLAPAAGEVLGFEQVPAALADARRNLQLNGFDHVQFVEGDVLASLAALPAGSAPDVCVVDPPRAGLHPELPARIAALGARRLVYVSCNPQSLARDAAALAAAGYALERVRPIDLFPHTPHVECVATFVPRGRA